MYSKWKQRLYAFLIRRIVGPYLAPNSLQKLHESIEVSLHEGKFVFTDVDLNTAYLTLLISKRGDARVGVASVARARIRKLQINLSLEEPDSKEYSSSVAWRAIKLGRTSSSVSDDDSAPGVYLLAQVEVEGLFIELEPDATAATTCAPVLDAPSKPQQTETSSSSVISSYLDAALSSLRLSLQLRDLQIKFSTRSSVHKQWVNLQLASANYHDIENQPGRAEQKTKSQTALHKAIEFSGITLKTGEEMGNDDDSADAAQFEPAIIGKTEGSGQIMFRVIQYHSEESTRATDASGSNDNAPVLHVQHDIEATLSQKVNMLVGERSLRRIVAVSTAISEQVEASFKLKDKSDDRTKKTEARQSDVAVNSTKEEEEDLELVTGIMKQYVEARHWAERNEVRGGVLIPRTASEVDGEGSYMAFDAFFDANDHSFYHYNSLMGQAALSSTGSLDGSGFVHTRLKLNLPECGIKVEFPRRISHTSGKRDSRLMNEEYMLLRLSDINLSSARSAVSSEFSLDVSRVSVEDSCRHFGPKSEIGSILHFVQDETEASCSIVTEAPALSIRVSSRSKEMQSPHTKVDISLEPAELVLRETTLTNLRNFLNKVKLWSRKLNKDLVKDEVAVTRSESGENRRFQMSVVCPSVSVQVPLMPKDGERIDWSTSPFRRCGYALYGCPIAEYPSLDITLQSMSVSLLSTNENGGDDDLTSFDATNLPLSVELSSTAVLFGIIYPHVNADSVVVSMCRMDMLAMAGPAPVLLAYRRVATENQKAELGRQAFPVVPTISSFKARQEEDDDDDDNRGSRYRSAQGDSFSASLFEAPVRAADPQATMVEAATQCQVVIEIIIPDAVGDITNEESAALFDVLSVASRRAKEGEGVAFRKEEVQACSGDSSLVAIGVKIDQASLVFHISDSEVSASKIRWYSYKLLLEGLRTHCVIDQDRLSNIRLLAHECNLFEGLDLIGSRAESKEIIMKTFRDRAEAIRQRSAPTDLLIIRPIFFRSKLFSALSPESPSLLVDMLSDAGNSSWKVHFTAYNVTHRYDVESKWHLRLQNLVQSNKLKNDAADSSSAGENETSLFKVFISLADCNIDYTSPDIFDTAGRMIVRVGDCRVSSNVILPSGGAQACKVSLGDLTVQVCNNRHDHRFENVLLPRASTIFHDSELHDYTSQSAEKALQAMHLITMLTLDATDMALSLTRNIQEQGNSVSNPKITAALTFGNLCLYGCKDSFSCFTRLVGELQLRITSIHRDALESMKSHVVQKPGANDVNDTARHSTEEFYDAQADEVNQDVVAADTNDSPFVAMTGPNADVQGDAFALDGYDWTTVDHEWSKHGGLSTGDEQSAKWYSASDMESSSAGESVQILPLRDITTSTEVLMQEAPPRGPQIIANHIQLQPSSDPLSQTDMDAAKYAKTKTSPPVMARILVRDLSFRCRFFDGYDWPHLQKRSIYQQDTNRLFVIDENRKQERELLQKVQENVDGRLKDDGRADKDVKRKAELLTELLDEDDKASGGATFRDTPLPEERGKKLQEIQEQRRLARRMNKFFQVSLSGLKARVDTFVESNNHRLASCVDLVVSDLFLAETISSDKPVKLLGEWLNEVEHPRLSTDGMIMMKMVTWHPVMRVTDDWQIVNDESIARLHILPLRCRLDQRALRFAQAFFAPDDDEEAAKHQWLRMLNLTEIPPPKLTWFKVKSCKMKVDYKPIKMNVDALREGCYVELINLSPLVDMVIVLKEVVIFELVGFGPVLREMLARWIEDICATQLYKFVTNASPFQPFSAVGEGAAEMFILPWQAYREGKGVGRAVRSGATAFAESVAYETLNTTAKLTELTGRALSSRGPVARPLTRLDEATSPLPSRPQGTPRGVRETTHHALESLARGVETANYKVVIVPYREYQRSGPTGAARSVVRGIPVAIMAPIGAASEALSYTLLGARNQVRPDIRREEEANERGLLHDS